MPLDDLLAARADQVVRGLLGSHRNRDGSRGVGRSGPIPASVRQQAYARLNRTGQTPEDAADRAIIDQLITEQRRAANAADRLENPLPSGRQPRAPATSSRPAGGVAGHTYTVRMTERETGGGTRSTTVVTITSDRALTRDQVREMAMEGVLGPVPGFGVVPLAPPTTPAVQWEPFIIGYEIRS